MGKEALHTPASSCVSPLALGMFNSIPAGSSEALTTGMFIAPMALYIISTINIIKLSGETQGRKRGTAPHSNDADRPWLHGDRILTSLDLSVGIRLTNHMGRSSSHTVEYWWTFSTLHNREVGFYWQSLPKCVSSLLYTQGFTLNDLIIIFLV